MKEENMDSKLETAKETVRKEWKPALASMAAGALLWGMFLAYAVAKG